MSVEEIKALVRRYVDEPLNKGNFAVWDELCAPEFTVRNLADNTVQSREDQKRSFSQVRTNFPDFKNTLEEVIVEGDRAAFRWTMSWTEEGKLKKAVGITILRIRNGKVVDDYFISDFVKMEQPVSS